MNSEKRREAAPVSRGRGTTGTAPGTRRPGLEAARLPVGDLARDVRLERSGIVMDHQDGLVWLRPEGGGTEWTAAPGDVRPMNVRERAEALMWQVARANARSRGEVL